MSAIPKAIEPYYSLADPTAIPLYSGPLLYPPRGGKAAEQVDGTVSLQLAPEPRIIMRGAVSGQFELHDLLEAGHSPQLPPMVTVPNAPVALPGIGSVSWPGPVGGYVVGKAAAVRRVVFHLANFMPMGGAIITDGVSTWTGRVTVNVGPWVVAIDAHSDLEEVLAAVGERGGYAVTHTCSLERRDRRPFAFARCQELLTCLTWCLWFCRASAHQYWCRSGSMRTPVPYGRDGQHPILIHCRIITGNGSTTRTGQSNSPHCFRCSGNGTATHSGGDHYSSPSATTPTLRSWERSNATSSWPRSGSNRSPMHTS